MVIKYPIWLDRFIKYSIKHKIYLLFPLMVLTGMNYWKDGKISKQEGSITSQAKVIQNLIVSKVGNAGTLEHIGTPIFFKELRGDYFIVTYVNPAYNKFLPNGVDRLDLFGRNGYYLDDKFGAIWQAYDFKASKSKLPIKVKEPYRENGIEKEGWFLKGRIWEIKDKVVVYGIFIEED